MSIWLDPFILLQKERLISWLEKIEMVEEPSIKSIREEVIETADHTLVKSMDFEIR